MNEFAGFSRCRTGGMALLLVVVAAGCSGGSGSGLGTVVLDPTVTAVAPRPLAVAVPVNTKIFTAAFSKAMDPATLTAAAFTLACPVGTALAGAVTYRAAGEVATLTLPALTNLPPGVLCTATVTTAAKDTAGTALPENFVWTFTTGATPDTTAATVTSTTPPANATGVALNTLVTARFSEAMDPGSLGGANFTLACPAATAIVGSVGYAVNGQVATFRPAGNLPAGTVCTATLGAGAKDVAGNAMAAATVWSFTTGAAQDLVPPRVDSTNPVHLGVGICVNKTINATFSEAMDPLTITSATFTLAAPSGAPVVGVVAYDPSTRIATFNPVANLTGAPASRYTATIKGGPGGVKDLAGNTLAADKVTTFTTQASTCATAPTLGAVAPFGGFGGGAGMTNDGTATRIGGDIGSTGASTTMTGFRDSVGDLYTVVPGVNEGIVAGRIYTNAPPPGGAGVGGTLTTKAIADAAHAGALAAFNAISPANLPGGIDVASLAACPSCGGLTIPADELAGRTLPPGVYLSQPSGKFKLGGLGNVPANLTLDAQGDANAVWVFQTAAATGTLTVGLTGPATPAVPIKVVLANGAQAKNVYWYVPAGASIGTGSTMVGTLLSDAGISISTTGGSPPNAVVTTLNGRAIALSASVTMTNTVIDIPAP